MPNDSTPATRSPLALLKRAGGIAGHLMKPEFKEGFRKLWSGRYDLLRGPTTYNRDGLATRHNADFIDDPRFAKAYAAGKATTSWYDSDLQWRVHTLCWAADRGCRLEGDFVECGVNRGGYSRSVMEYVGFNGLSKKFYLLDTYAGLVDKYLTPEEKSRGLAAGTYQECYEHVKKVFAEFPSAVIIRGAVPETLAQVPTKKIAYLSIDMNSSVPEIAAAEYFWPKLVSGASMVLDDYGFTPRHYAQKHAFDQFAAAKNLPLLTLPTGQGLIIKP